MRRKGTQPKSTVERYLWSSEEIHFVRKFYSREETTWIARQLGRTVHAVRCKAYDLNLKKIKRVRKN